MFKTKFILKVIKSDTDLGGGAGWNANDAARGDGRKVLVFEHSGYFMEHILK